MKPHSSLDRDRLVQFNNVQSAFLNDNHVAVVLALGAALLKTN